MRFLTNQLLVGHDQQKWFIKMLRYDFEILYWVWCEIKVVDALSQNPKFENKLRVVSVIKVVGIEGINHEVTQNKKL